MALNRQYINKHNENKAKTKQNTGAENIVKYILNDSIGTIPKQAESKEKA